jgi:hypothetical protein
MVHGKVNLAVMDQDKSSVPINEAHDTTRAKPL